MFFLILVFPALKRWAILATPCYTALLRRRTLSRSLGVRGSGLGRLRISLRDRISIHWTLRWIPLRSGSLGSPASFHRSSELRPAFRREIEFPLRFFGRASFLRDGRFRFTLRRRAALFLSGRRRSFRRPARRCGPSGRFLLRLPCLRFRHRLQFPFHLGQLLRTLLQASFELPDLLPQSLQVHKDFNSAQVHPVLSILSKTSNLRPAVAGLRLGKLTSCHAAAIA